MERRFYISDLHFSHRGIAAGRPFASTDEMDAVLLQNWRKRVGPQDMVFIVGDLFGYRKEPEEILRQLTGRLILVEGNHDALWLKQVRAWGFFEGIYPKLTVRDGGRTLKLTHVPDLSLLTGGTDYLLYGHLHHNPWHSPLWPALRREARALNVGVDIALAAGGFAGPALLEEWIAYNQIFCERNGDHVYTAG